MASHQRRFLLNSIKLSDHGPCLRRFAVHRVTFDFASRTDSSGAKSVARTHSAGNPYCWTPWQHRVTIHNRHQCLLHLLLSQRSPADPQPRRLLSVESLRLQTCRYRLPADQLRPRMPLLRFQRVKRRRRIRNHSAMQPTFKLDVVLSRTQIVMPPEVPRHRC